MNTELKVQKWHVETKEFGAYIGVNQAKVGSVAKFYIAGWITQEDFKKIARLKTYRGYEDYPMYVVHYSALKTIAELAFLQELP